jgi:hypothetical protein
MSQLLQQFAEANGVKVVNSTGAVSGYASGLPLDASSLAVDDTSAISSYHMGLPLTANGRVAVAFNGAVAEIQDGARPVDSAGRVAMESIIGAASYTGGVPYDVNNRVTASGVGIPVGAGPFSDGFSTGFDV